MKHKCIMFVRKPGANRTILPKFDMTCKKVHFFVRESVAHRFPKRGIYHEAMHMADIILFDTRVFKQNVGFD